MPLTANLTKDEHANYFESETGLPIEGIARLEC